MFLTNDNPICLTRDAKTENELAEKVRDIMGQIREQDSNIEDDQDLYDKLEETLGELVKQRPKNGSSGIQSVS